MRSEAAAYFPDAVSVTKQPPQAPNEHNNSTRTSEQDKTHTQLFESAQDISDQLSDFSDEYLLRQISQGTRDALTLLFTRYARPIRNVAQGILRDEAEADDLLQEVFLYIFRKAGLFDTAQGSARVWIFQLTYHRAISRRRYLIARHFYKSEELNEDVIQAANPARKPDAYAQPLDRMFGKELMARFNTCLSPEQRQTIELYFFEGYSLKEIAQHTKQTPGNVRNHYYRGLERIRTHIFPDKVRPLWTK